MVIDGRLVKEIIVVLFLCQHLGVLRLDVLEPLLRVATKITLGQRLLSRGREFRGHLG